MTTDLNLQQNQISLKEQHQLRQKLAAKKDVDYSNLQVGAKIISARGHLVNDPAWKAPIVAVEDTFQNVKNIGKGLKGEGDDHNLGMMNDVTMKAGGLAIAGYLATKRFIPVKKGMEFVGFGAFVASMAIWPKAFIQAPIQAMYGFNFNQQYVDSYGRKKSFHTDPQYTPWDLYDPKKLDKIGDKMGIDPNMENRQALVKEKMTKIATQANTLWMLTAGIAVPTMCSLLSSQAEKLMNLGHKNLATSNVDSKFKKLGEKLSVAGSETTEKNEKLAALLKENSDKAVGPKFVDSLTDMMVGSDDHQLRTQVKADLAELLQSHKSADVSKEFGDIQISAVVNNKELKIDLKENLIKSRLEARGLNSNVLISGAGSEENVGHIRNILTDMITGHKVFQNASDSECKVLNAAATAVLNTKFQTPSMILTAQKRDAIQEAAKHLAVFKKDSSVILEYVSHKVGEKEDSLVAREWQKATGSVYKAIGFTDKDFAEAKASDAKARQILDAKLTALCKEGNGENYKKAVTSLAKTIAAFEESVEKGAIPAAEGQEPKSFVEGVKDVTRKVYGRLGEKLSKGTDTQGKFTRTASYVSAYDHSQKRGYEDAVQKVFPGSAAHNVVTACDQRVIGAKNSLRKALHLLDVYKRIESGSVRKALEATGRVIEEKDEKGVIKNVYADKVISVMKYALMEGHLGSHVVKFDVPEREVYRDAMIQLYCMDQDHLGAKVQEAFKANGQSIDAYKSQLPAEIKLDTATEEALKESKLKDFRQGLADIADQTVNDRYRHKTEHSLIGREVCPEAENVRKHLTAATTTAEKQMTVGETFAKLTHDVSEQASNTKLSFKIMAVAGVAVAAVTLVAPLFFGKVKAPQQQAKKEVEANV